MYLGFVITATGVSPTKEKVRDIKEAAPTSDVAELQSLIVSANFLRKFVPEFAEILSPLYQLLRKGTTWRWGKREQDAFTNIKTSMCSDTVLRHYEPDPGLINSSM